MRVLATLSPAAILYCFLRRHFVSLLTTSLCSVTSQRHFVLLQVGTIFFSAWHYCAATHLAQQYSKDNCFTTYSDYNSLRYFYFTRNRSNFKSNSSHFYKTKDKEEVKFHFRANLVNKDSGILEILEFSAVCRKQFHFARSFCEFRV